MKHHTLPPGKYYIGDPCYVFNDDTWQKLLETTDCFERDEPTVFNDHQLWGASTAYGDGVYADQNGNDYPVDAGVLAAIPVGLIENPEGEEHGTMVDAPNGLQVECDDEGNFWFGSIFIRTDPRDDGGDIDGGYYDLGEDEFI